MLALVSCAAFARARISANEPFLGAAPAFGATGAAADGLVAPVVLAEVGFETEIVGAPTGFAEGFPGPADFTAGTGLVGTLCGRPVAIPAGFDGGAEPVRAALLESFSRTSSALRFPTTGAPFVGGTVVRAAGGVFVADRAGTDDADGALLLMEERTLLRNCMGRLAGLLRKRLLLDTHTHDCGTGPVSEVLPPELVV